MASTSSSSIKKSFKYDVFLSFRGRDTRHNFVGHLYNGLKQKGIETYMDDKKIEQGKTISDQLIKSIEDSRFFLIVFSKTYASSSWCLDELVKIMECHKTAEQTACPIFFDVEPTEVRKQSGAVGEAFVKHKKAKAVGKWRVAMKEAADLAGWALKETANRDESEFVRIIVDAIFKKLSSNRSNDDEKLVGMDMRINEVLASLKISTEDVRVIGIKGMGGAGKTTLARAVYDHISSEFEGKSFVENVRKVSQSSLSGLKSLQKQVLSNVLNDQDITVDSVADGKDMMGKMMRSIKVLVVLDDVDHLAQLEALAGRPNWFKSGSTIIITTRDEQVLVSHGVSLIRNVNLLSDKEALCLFSRYAFGRDIPIQGYEQLSEQVVLYAAGLPLTIRVLGSFLRGKKELEWKDGLERLKAVPQKEILKVLEISIDDLEDDYKEIFLDVACLLKGEQKDRAIQVFESCGFNAIIGLKVLEQKSLITISEYGSLGMHDQLEEMGKNIVFRLHPDDSYRRSRLWINEDVENILASDWAKVNEAIRCIKLSPLTLNLETVMRGLGNMKKLRALYMCSGPNWKVNQVSQRFPNALKYLSWRDYPFSSLHETFQANNLVGLDMSFSAIENIQSGRTRKVLDKLRYLNLSYTSLKTLDLEVTPNLEILYLEHCNDLIKLDIPDGSATLQSLNLSNSKLKILNLGPTPNLETLTLVGCCDLEEFYFPLECTKLKSLSLNGPKLRDLILGETPDLETLSLERLRDFEEFFPYQYTKLKSLSLHKSRLTSLDLGLTPDLETLILAECDLKAFHMPSQCQKLKSLSLNGSKIRDLHLGSTLDLETLSLAGCDLEELHVPFGPKLISLILDNSKLRYLSLGPTPDLGNLSFAGCDLEELHMPSGCPKLKSLSLNSSRLKKCTIGPTPDLEILSLISLIEFNLEESMTSRRVNLRSLDLCRSTLSTLDIELTPNLKRLDLKDCSYLVEINAPVGCLEKLVYLDLSGCGRFKSFLFDKRSKSLEAGSLPELHLIADPIDKCPTHPDHNLPKFQFTCFYEEDAAASSFGNLEKLISVGQCVCAYLESFSRSVCSLNSLGKLTLEGNGIIVPNILHHLECLKELTLSNTDIRYLSDSVCKLKQLTYLKLQGCKCLQELPKGFGMLKSLKELILSNTTILRLPGSFCKLKHLKSLNLKDCDNLEKLPENFGQLVSLEELNLSSTKIKHLPDSFCKLKHLKSLNLKDCHILEKLPEDFGQLESLEELSLCNSYIKNLPDSFRKLKHLKSLNLKDCYNLEKLPEDFGQLESLEELSLCNSYIKNLPDSFRKLKHLKSLNLKDCYNLEKLPEDFGQLESLEELSLCTKKIKNLPDSFCKLKHLKSLNLKDCRNLEKLPEDFDQLESLEELSFCYNSKIKNLPDSFSLLKQLKSLNLRDCINLEKLHEDFGQLESLEKINLRYTKIKNLPDSFSLLKQLKSLNLRDCINLEKLPEDFGQLESLEKLNLRYTKIKNLPDCFSLLNQLKSLNFKDCHNLEKLPEDFGQLESLEKLSLWNTKIKNLPDSFGLLKQLKSLKLQAWQDLKELPNAFGQLKCLVKLTLSGYSRESLDVVSHDIKHLLDSISTLKHLEILKFMYLDFRNTSKDLGQLGRLLYLEKLIIEDTHLIDIPNSICEMKHLKQLCLCRVIGLKKLPEEIGHLECLEELDITGTDISHLPQSIFQLKGLRIIGTRNNLVSLGFTSLIPTSVDDTFCYILP